MRRRRRHRYLRTWVALLIIGAMTLGSTLRVTATAGIPIIAAAIDLESQAMAFTRPFEGSRSAVYLDTTGHRTIGVGFNLDRPGAAADLLESLGEIDTTAILAGQSTLNEAQIDALFRRDIRRAIEQARREHPVFDQLPRQAQLIVIDMTFNLGSLSGWPMFRAALLRQDYPAAAQAMADSRWAKQTGNRARKLIAMMRGLGDVELTIPVAN